MYTGVPNPVSHQCRDHLSKWCQEYKSSMSSLSFVVELWAAQPELIRLTTEKFLEHRWPPVVCWYWWDWEQKSEISEFSLFVGSSCMDRQKSCLFPEEYPDSPTRKSIGDKILGGLDDEENMGLDNDNDEAEDENDDDDIPIWAEDNL